MSTPESPAAPFYFMLFQKDGKYVVIGEGTGQKAATDRAYAKLVRLTEPEVRTLLVSAKKAARSSRVP